MSDLLPDEPQPLRESTPPRRVEVDIEEAEFAGFVRLDELFHEDLFLCRYQH